jgi:hypothetical protein
MVFHIGNNAFKYKKEALAFTRKKLKNGRQGIHTTKSSLYNFMYDLLRIHPQATDKIGCGIQHFNLTVNTSNSIHIEFIRTDGTLESFSWLTSAGFKKITNSLTNLKDAMRYSVHKHTLKYKQDHFQKHGNMTCKLCNVESVGYDGLKYHTDHIIEFHIIVSDFIKDREDVPILFAKDGYMTCFQETDDQFKNTWVEYHNDKAVYRILCSNCNSKSWKKLVK